MCFCVTGLFISVTAALVYIVVSLDGYADDFKLIRAVFVQERDGYPDMPGVVPWDVSHFAAFDGIVICICRVLAFVVVIFVTMQI